MASQNQVSIANLALLSIGARVQVSSINPSDNSVAANAIATLYTFVFQNLARTAKWGCLKKQVTLTMIQAAQGTPENPNGTSLSLPQQPWLYGYVVPSDSLMVRRILPPINTSSNTTNQLSIANNVTPYIPSDYNIPYEIGQATDSTGNPIEVIYTNQENAVANYTVDQENPQFWDSLFTKAYVASLAAYLVPALSLNPQLMQAQIGLAEEAIRQARATDGNETTISQDHIPDWIRARSGASGYLRFGPQYNAFGYIQMPWPA